MSVTIVKSWQCLVMFNCLNIKTIFSGYIFWWICSRNNHSPCIIGLIQGSANKTTFLHRHHLNTRTMVKVTWYIRYTLCFVFLSGQYIISLLSISVIFIQHFLWLHHWHWGIIPREIWNPLSKTVLNKCSLIWNKGPVKICHDDVIKWKHFPHHWPFVRGIHYSPEDSPHKGQWCRALMFSLICAWTNGWANNGDADDSRCHHTHYDVTAMKWP